MPRTLRLVPAVLLLLGAGGAMASPSPRAAHGPLRHPKRGVASAKYLASDPSKLGQLDASWAYDWSSSAPRHPRSAGWVPMVWGTGSVTPAVIASLRADRLRGHARYLLGFNEPDMSAQSNMTPQEAAALWPELEQTGLTLGSPAPAVPTDGWLARFMTLVRQRHLRVDFIALHYYQDFTNPQSVPDLRQELTAIHDAYRLPIWITEIGAIDIRTWGAPMSRPPTTPQAVAYMRRLFAMLDGLSFVRRYAWFTDNCWSDTACRFGSLFNGKGRLTAAGRTFRAAP